ncbi:MAG TPA: TrkH family potassium uptake protein [Draconibacterium sp.]|nr:TrkH family potassium uptake protein [Draconibacterium sp.]HRX12802.1 TrkH family potassium uptake protein [Draconibacterium sp.]
MGKIFNLRLNFPIVGKSLFILTAALFATTLVALLFSEPVKPFLISGLIAFLFGLLLYIFKRPSHEIESLTKKDASLIVSFSWIFFSLIGALPYIISQSIPGFINAFFESMSGFTTTGASILTDIEILPKSILFWRSLTHWIGGIGIIVLVIVIMPSLNMGSYNLFTFESSVQEKIQPKIKAVGRRLMLIYFLLTITEIFFLVLGNMNLFESVCHAFGTVATGGFSPKNTSIAGYSPYIQYVIMIFMLLAGVNFVLHYYFFKRDFKKIKENEELKFYLFVVFVVGIILTLSLYFKMNKPFEESFREAFFQIISIVTCTGFASADYLMWPSFAWTIIFLAMFLGGSTGSTAGGIKMARHLVLLKNIKRFFLQLQSPNAVKNLKLNNNIVSDENNRTILSFIVIYFLIFAFGSVLIVAFGVDGETAGSAVATCMAGIGPGIGTVGPVSNFAHLPDIVKIILSFLMLIGRLEIYTLIILFFPNFWKN